MTEVGVSPILPKIDYHSNVPWVIAIDHAQSYAYQFLNMVKIGSVTSYFRRDRLVSDQGNC